MSSGKTRNTKTACRDEFCSVADVNKWDESNKEQNFCGKKWAKSHEKSREREKKDKSRDHKAKKSKTRKSENEDLQNDQSAERSWSIHGSGMHNGKLIIYIKFATHDIYMSKAVKGLKHQTLKLQHFPGLTVPRYPWSCKAK